jgi:hypothetical protein
MQVTELLEQNERALGLAKSSLNDWRKVVKSARRISLPDYIKGNSRLIESTVQTHACAKIRYIN